MQGWTLKSLSDVVSDPNVYNIINQDTSLLKYFLSASGDGESVEMASSDDGSGMQEWTIA